MKLSADRSSQTTPAVNPAPQIQGQFECDVQDISLPVWQQGERWDDDGPHWLHAIPSSLRWDAAVGRQLAADHVLVASRFQPHQYQTVVPGEACGNRQSGDEADLFPAPHRCVAAFVSPLVSTSDGAFCFLVETLRDIRGAKRDIQIETECVHTHTQSAIALRVRIQPILYSHRHGNRTGVNYSGWSNSMSSPAARHLHETFRHVGNYSSARRLFRQKEG